MKHSLIILACSSVLFTALSAQAASDGIRRDRDYECAIYMCLPTGFKEGCSQVFKVYWERITDLDFLGRRKYTDLPAYHYCLEGNNVEITDLNAESIEKLEQGLPVTTLPEELTHE